MLIRPVTLEDRKAFHELALIAPLGLTSLPKQHKHLEQKFDKAIRSFYYEIESPSDELYLFVLEDTEKQKIVGISGIISKIGVSHPIYNYQIKEVKTPLNQKGIQVLKSQQILRGPSELCALFILPEYRHGGYGRLLSLSRFLYVANHPERFEKTLIAEIRGEGSHLENAVFWNGTGRCFYDVSLKKLIENIEDDPSIIPSLVSPYPIIIEMLPKEVRDIIGISHHASKPAEKMLLEEGFKFTREVDYMDAGPKFQCKVSQIRTVKKSKLLKIHNLCSEIQNGETYIISNTKNPFRAVLGMVNIRKKEITRSVANVLQVDIGDQIRFATLKG